MVAFINSNIASLNAQRNLTTSQSSLSTSLQRLSSGLRINSAKDDAAGLAIAERFTSQIRGSNQAARNANDGISLAQTAEGDLAQIGNNLQRVRVLAVQSANAVNSASDRAALDAEAQALLSEIDRVAQNSTFNGVKLLDGSFNAQTFQVGANATSSDQIQIAGINSARTAALGGSGTSTSTTVTGGVTTGAITAGQLTLNGQQVGASSAGAAPGQNASSAASIATAINAVSSQSGVTASANGAVVTGAAATVFTTIAANTFNINGVNVGAVAAGGDAIGQGANLAAAINLVSAQSGVSASANVTTGAVTLTGADGRDVSIGLSGTAANNAAATANKAALLTQTGFATGTVGTQAEASGVAVAQTVGIANGTGVVISSGGIPNTANGTVNNLTVSLNGAAFVAVPPFATVNSSSTNGSNLSNAINTALGVSATAAGVSSLIFVQPGTLTFAIGGTAVDLTTANANQAALIAQTGLSAAQLGTQAYGSASGVAATTVNNHGTLALSSDNVAGIVVSGGAPANAGLTAGTTAASTTLTTQALSTVSIKTAAAATNALAAIDGALANVNSSRADLGAVQNRFTSVVASLQTTAENLTASRSRIQDADFAQETAALTRAQVLQQAGTAILAQANALPQGVLALLR